VFDRRWSNHARPGKISAKEMAEMVWKDLRKEMA
jgi:hypothetical protein